MDSRGLGKKFRGIFWFLARVFVGGVFAYAGFMKLTEPAANFQAALEIYPIIPMGWTPGLAAALPWLEWIGGMFLLLGFRSRPAALLLTLLSFGFIVALSGPVWFGQGLRDCGCFGSRGPSLSVQQMYLLDGVNLILGGLLFLKKRHPFALDNRWK